jgi:glycosyltransferase involved in cell wall biosynthesis
MIKILTAIVAPPHLSVSGAARAAELLSAALATRCEVTVASMMPPQVDCIVRREPVSTWLTPGAPWSLIPKRYRTPFYRSDIASIAVTGGFDLLHLHNPVPGLEMLRIARACRSVGLPLVISTHGYNEIANGRRIHHLGAVQRLMWDVLAYQPVARATRLADAVLLLSPADEPIVRSMGYRGDLLSVVPNGMKPPVAVDPASKNAALEKFALSPADPSQITCMFLANHTPNKGLPVLMRAFSMLDIPFLLIVGGERRDAIEYEAFSRLLKKHQRVLVTGALSDEEVSVLMERSDIFVFPTLADTLPLVLYEALSHGLPVVASDVGGIRYQIDNRCGVLLSPGDAPALADAINKLAAQRTLLSDMSLHAAARARSLPNWASSAALTAAAYEAVLARQRSAASAALMQRTRRQAVKALFASVSNARPRQRIFP